MSNSIEELFKGELGEADDVLDEIITKAQGVQDKAQAAKKALADSAVLDNAENKKKAGGPSKKTPVRTGGKAKKNDVANPAYYAKSEVGNAIPLDEDDLQFLKPFDDTKKALYIAELEKAAVSKGVALQTIAQAEAEGMELVELNAIPGASYMSAAKAEARANLSKAVDRGPVYRQSPFVSYHSDEDAKLAKSIEAGELGQGALRSQSHVDGGR